MSALTFILVVLVAFIAGVAPWWTSVSSTAPWSLVP